MTGQRTRRDALRVIGAVGVGGLTALAGCAESSVDAGGSSTPDDDGTDSAPATTEPTVPRTNSVGMSCHSSGQEYRFVPALTHVEPGTTVSFGVTSQCRQRTQAYHPDNDAPLRIPEGVEPWSSDVMQRNGTFEYTFELEGVYDHFGLHEGTGQVGSVVVGSPDPDGQPGLTEPQSDLPEAAKTALSDLNERTLTLLEGGNA